jgi:hypothetical protein
VDLLLSGVGGELIQTGGIAGGSGLGARPARLVVKVEKQQHEFPRRHDTLDQVGDLDMTDAIDDYVPGLVCATENAPNELVITEVALELLAELLKNVPRRDVQAFPRGFLANVVPETRGGCRELRGERLNEGSLSRRDPSRDTDDQCRHPKSLS